MTRRGAGFLLLLAVCAVLVSSASAGGLGNRPTSVSTEPPPNAPTLTAEEALLDDAEEVAKLYGISVDEALQRLDLQLNVIPEFENAVAAGEARYGGLVIQNNPSYRVVVLLTSGSSADLARYISDPRLRGLLEVRNVARPLKQLKLAQIRALRLRSVIEFDSDIDVLANSVRLDVVGTHASEVAAKAQTLRAAAARSGEPLPDWVVVRGVPSLGSPQLDIFGGLKLENATSYCTSGFSVTGPGGSGGVTTAGHCDEVFAYAGNALMFKGSTEGLEHDLQWHSRANTNFPAKIYRGQGVYGPITGKKARWNQPIGATVCKRGVTTDRTCGQINSKDYAPNWVPNATPTFITAFYNAASGDSGGPVFVGNEAWGMHLGTTPSPSIGVYMASNYIESGLNLYIKGT